MKGFTVESQMMGVRAMVDGGLGLSFHTKELSQEEKVAIMQFHMNTGWLLFSPNEIPEDDVPKTMAERDAKTPSQRLRAVLYVRWQQTKNNTPEEIQKNVTFEEYYVNTMEKLIESVKAKLDK